MSLKLKRNVIILGAAGRDFHDFLTFWRHHEAFNVVCFTATQIPGIENRVFPAELSGEQYPKGIPIYSQDDLEKLIYRFKADICSLSYSDLPYPVVMSLGSRVNAAGAHFMMLSPHETMLRSIKPVIAITAVRTGCGKSQTTRYICRLVKALGLKPVVLRHPMPYGKDLLKQKVQRFETMKDLKKNECTIEEIEEYEGHIEEGNLLFAGVDYEAILRQAETEADVVIWDGGNNDCSFINADLYLCVADALRPGHERAFYPGETNIRMADIVLVNKVNEAKQEDLEKIQQSIHDLNSDAIVMLTRSTIDVDTKGTTEEKARKQIEGKNVLVVDDGPTLTHGGMAFGAGYVLAKKLGGNVIDPRPFAVGSLKNTFAKFPHLHDVIPAMGYSESQCRELEETIAAAHADAVVIGTPVNLANIIKIKQTAVRVRYELAPSESDNKALRQAIETTKHNFQHKCRSSRLAPPQRCV